MKEAVSNTSDHIKLSELTNHIKSVIQSNFNTKSYWIIAEISSHKMYMNGDRHYFEFVEKADNGRDEVAKIRGIAWRQGSQSIQRFEKATGQQFRDGIEVLSKVCVEFHTQYGLQLILEEIDQSWTLGNLAKEREATLAKLVADNPDAIQLIEGEYITTNKKVIFPSVIQNIAIIGSPNSAGFKDFMSIIESNRFKYKFVINIYESTVQGAEAHHEIVTRLIDIYKSGKTYDSVVIIRGGGAKTDFLVFDNYNLARAVARFPIPIIAGIGHMTDHSIVDMMVKQSVNAPTKAAEFIIAHNRHFEERLAELRDRIMNKSQRMVSQCIEQIGRLNFGVVNFTRNYLNDSRNQLLEISNILNKLPRDILSMSRDDLLNISGILSTNPKILVSNSNQNLINITANIKSYMTKYLQFKKGYLGHYEKMIGMAKPESIMNRGFAIVKKDGKAIGNPDLIQARDKITVILRNYNISSTVDNKNKREDGESYL